MHCGSHEYMTQARQCALEVQATADDWQRYRGGMTWQQTRLWLAEVLARAFKIASSSATAAANNQLCRGLSSRTRMTVAECPLAQYLILQ